MYIMIVFLQFAVLPLHPALAPSQEVLEKVWYNGYERAKRDKSLYGSLKFARRGIGRINHETVSWVTFQHPRLLAYEAGFNARKLNLSEAQQEASRQARRDSPTRSASSPILL
ncbi:MAG TPA: hypothetical protein VFB38_15770 [Chthonomonadaceae bacterium]|nr:hypothetical protein [Chthonomonadaceae bacterium]